MGGGLAAVAAGSYPDYIATAFLMDPVDWNFESNRVDSGGDEHRLAGRQWGAPFRAVFTLDL